MAPKKGASKKPALSVPDSDHIVFGDEKKSRKAKSANATVEDSLNSSKPTARQVVGGASWTGKLPVNLLSEHCQRQKWNKPGYSMRQMPDREGDQKTFRSEVTLSKTDPKTRETISIPPLRLPSSDAHLANQPSALEARHFAATYALFRVQSMRNIHMTLPPNYRDLWKGDFTRLKKQDIEAERAWKYDEDPFAAEAKRQEILLSVERRKQDEQKRQEHQGGRETASTVPMLSRGREHNSKSWEHHPVAVMGQQIRLDIEALLRRRTIWNRLTVSLPQHQRNQILDETIDLGFRRIHVEEALSYCRDKEEVLEWLLVHVPEDDLPRWTFPPNYSAGLVLVSGDVQEEAKLKRLAAAGYSSDLCLQVLRSNKGDEALAAFDLQRNLVPMLSQYDDLGTHSSATWEEEMATLEATLGSNFSMTGYSQCTISITTNAGQACVAHFRCPEYGYPDRNVPAISLEIGRGPAYVRLAATKMVVEHAHHELLGELMLFNICLWLEMELPSIIENPGPLLNLHTSVTETCNKEDVSSLGKEREGSASNSKKSTHRRLKEDLRPDAYILKTWKTLQDSKEQLVMLAVRKGLPAWAKKTQIIQLIKSHQVTIISGDTGSGKSTQVVQFVLDNAIEELHGSKTNILCTQPRRVAALSLADRVSSERCSRVGDEIGYVIRGESKVSQSTKITFMTTGVLLRRLQSFTSTKEALADVSHVFVDEVHERSLDTDFLLALLRDCLQAQPELKVILMSATIDADIFAAYFGGPELVASVEIEGRAFPVRDVYLDEVLGLTNTRLSSTDMGKAIQALGSGINYELIRDLVLHIDAQLANQDGAILIFLPGTMEIERCLKAISDNRKILALPLHASLLTVEQRRVFPPAPAGQRKVIAATNVAETSVTIEDIVAVIDTGKVKETTYDIENNIVRLEEVWASQAACKQRKGRAGRVRAGTCYKLFTKSSEVKMRPRNVPEILRVPLEQLCLSVKATNTDLDVATFLEHTLTPPSSGAVVNAMQVLHTVGALEREQMTALGSCMAMLPIDLRCAKLLIYGALFDCLESCLTIASILAVKSPFVSPKDKREQANNARMRFTSAEGDLILEMRAYEEWWNLSQRSSRSHLSDWCSTNFVSQQTMRDISSSRRQLLDSLRDTGLVPSDYAPNLDGRSADIGSDQMVLLTALIAAALQPQLAVIAFPSKKYIASVSGAKELDPEAKTIKFFIPDENAVTNNGSSAATVEVEPNVVNQDKVRHPTMRDSNKRRPTPLSRVFIHPSSCLFSAQTFRRHSTHVSYFAKMMTTKPFIRNLTPLNIYSLLLFGGRLDLDTFGRGLVIGDTWKVQGWARIGVLVSRLKLLLDEELRQSVEGGGVLLGKMTESEVIQLVRRLLVLNGQDH